MEAVLAGDIVDEDGGVLAIDADPGFGVGDGQVLKELVAGAVVEELGGGLVIL